MKSAFLLAGMYVALALLASGLAGLEDCVAKFADRVVSQQEYQKLVLA